MAVRLCMGAEMKKKPTVWVHDIVNTASTGDIILFSSKHAGSKITKFFTNSEWDHVGIVIKPSATRCYIVEWGGGLFACDLIERLTEYYAEDGRAITLRRLQLQKSRSKLEDKLEGYVDYLFRNHLGSNQIIPMGQVVRAARRQLFGWSTKNAVTDDVNQASLSHG